VVVLDSVITHTSAWFLDRETHQLVLGANGDGGVFPGTAEPKNVQKAEQRPYAIPIKIMQTALNHPAVDRLHDNYFSY